MEISLEILAGAVAIGLGLVRVVEFLITKLYESLSGKKNGYDKMQYEAVSEIGSNHLHTIEDCIKDQTKDNNDWHQKQFEILCEINANIKALK